MSSKAEPEPPAPATEETTPPPSADTDSSQLPPTPQEQDCQACLSWVRAVVGNDEQRSLPERIQDLADGTWLLRVLSHVDAQHFRSAGDATGDGGSSSNFVMRLGTLKRLSKLMAQYYTDTLQLSTSTLPTPDLDEIARSSSPTEVAKLCKLALGITIQSDQTKTSHISAIQTLSQEDQHSLMVSIEDIMSSAVHTTQHSASPSKDDFSLPHEEHRQTLADLQRSRKEKDELQVAYLALVEQHQALKGSHEDTISEKEELNKEIERLHEEAQRVKASGGEALLKQEVESLKAQLRKSEDNLAEAETEVERLTKVEADLTKKTTDLQSHADEAVKLKDQMDEYRHMADKAQRTENALEKYKKKLEETAGVRRQLKDLEEQNSELIDRNASLEREYAKLADFKPLMENYKGQIDDLNGKIGRLNEELATSKYNVEQSTLQIKALEEARSKDAEELQLYQERVEELELDGGSGSSRRKARGRVSGPNEGAEGLAASDANRQDDGYDSADDVLVDDELEDALKGTTMTDLKLRVHQLSRDLKAAKRNKADSSRILVLENLLEDSQRLKKKYEDDYWREYKSRLQLSGEMEKIRNGTSTFGDGDEAAYALRLRLNELVSSSDNLKKELAELSLKSESTERELTIARSDLSLVNKDQLDVLSTLRASVDSEKSSLESQISTLKTDLTASREDTHKLSTQIQSLLMDKINLMEGGWSERETALQREKELGQLRTSLAGKKLPPDVEEMVLRLTTSNKDLQGQCDVLEERMGKAKTFIRQQDKLLKEARAGAGTGSGSEEEVKKLKSELQYMMSAWHRLALSKGYLVGANVGDAGERSTAGANGERSWLGKEQRGRMGVRSVLGRR